MPSDHTLTVQRGDQMCTRWLRIKNMPPISHRGTDDKSPHRRTVEKWRSGAQTAACKVERFGFWCSKCPVRSPLQNPSLSSHVSFQWDFALHPPPPTNHWTKKKAWFFRSVVLWKQLHLFHEALCSIERSTQWARKSMWVPSLWPLPSGGCRQVGKLKNLSVLTWKWACC